MSVARLLDEADALQVDDYLESLLDARARQPRAVEGLELDADERAAAELLATRFVRFHPSFRFEEALAARLREAGGGPRERGTLIHLPDPVRLTVRPDRTGSRRRVIIGGAIASGVSLAGAALFAWRVRSAPQTAFGRAARAAHRTRPFVRGHA